ncbi:FAD-binding oxidoreductase [Hydrocarboniphaga sp.]|uniref:FAD-binding oxidoreductase n=1 Tax=Hydrocarboniphaga sp. TaxID=2033016 RepID=UPI003D0CF321
MKFAVQIHIGPETRRFEAAGDTSLLDQAVGAGVPAHFSCKRGDCGQCIGTLLKGETAALIATQPSRVQADVYLCNATACSDIEIRLPYFPELADVPSIRSPAKIHELKRLSDDIVEVALRLPPTANFRFLPGQFIRLTNKSRVTRSYSLAAAADASKLLRIQVRKVDDGLFSAYLFDQAKSGDLLQLEGPQGHFFVRSAHQSAKTIFLATGTGIAPVHAILSSLTRESREALGAIDVYWGNRHGADEYLGERLRAMAADIGFRYWPLHSRELPEHGIRHVQDLMASHHPSLHDAAIFACGSAAMIDAARRKAVELGLPLDQFHSDPFTSS